MRKLVLVGAFALLLAPAAPAQEKGAWELGAFGRYTRYPGAFDTVSTKSENAWGFGGRVGWFFARNWSLELDGSYNPTDLDNFIPGVFSAPLDYVPFHLRGIWNAPIDNDGRASFLLGAGLNYNRYQKLDIADRDDFGFGGLVGLRARVYRQLHLRVDGLVDWVPSPVTAGDGSNIFLGAQAGLSLILGGKCVNRLDAVTISPTNASLFPGQNQQFSASGTMCDGTVTTPAILTWQATGGTVSTGGNFTAGMTAGSYMVIAQAGKHADTAMVTIRENTPQRLSLTPETATVDTGATHQFSARLFMADGSTRPVTTMTATGGTISNGLFRAGSQAGTFRVIASEGGLADTSTVTVNAPAPPPVRLVLHGAHFAFDRYNLRQPAQDTLRMVAQTLRDNPTVRIEVAGHTDWICTNAYNMRLSQARAESVKRFLVANGVAADRITTVWFGEDRPVADNNTAAGRAQNRRVEVNQQP